MKNKQNWSQKINISQQPAASSADPAPITVPLTLTLPAATTPAPSHSQDNIGRVLAIIAGVFFLIGAGFYLITAILV